MYYEEPEYGWEPSNVDEIYNETLDKIKSMLNDDIKNHIKSLESREESLKEQLENIKTREKKQGQKKLSSTIKKVN